MKKPSNIKEYKKELRVELQKKRASMSPKEKQQMDLQIFSRVLSLEEFKQAKTVMIYVSTALEVDTIGIINHCFENGKAVAVPRCVDGTRNMNFYLLDSLGELEVRTFGVMEPPENPQKMLTDFSDAVCIIPAMGADPQGYRLGYGGGYYDRFLENFKQKKIIITYHSCLLDKLWHGKHDIVGDIVVTNKMIKRPGKIQKQIPKQDKK